MEEANVYIFEEKSAFSNTSFTPFFHNGVEFKSMTHYLEYQKALMFGQKRLLKAVIHADTVSQAKQLTADMTHNQLRQWYGQLDDVAVTAQKQVLTESTVAASIDQNRIVGTDLRYE